MMKRSLSAPIRALPVIGLAAALTCLAACSGGASSSRQQASHTFVLGIPLAIPSFDPYKFTSGSGFLYFLGYLAYDSLINQKDDGTIVSGLAKSWQVTPAGVTFVLRNDVTCSDGAKLTASQVAADLNYVGNSRNQVPFYGLLTPDTPYVATGNDSAGSVTVRTKDHFGFLMETLGNVPIVCARGMADRSLLTHRSDGTGPYVLVSSNQTSLTFEVRAGYRWGPDGASTSAPGTPARLTVSVVRNPTTAATELLAGQLSASFVRGPDIERLNAAGLRSSAVPLQGMALAFNEQPDHVTSNEDVRRALVAALDFGELAQVIGGSASARAQGLRAGRPIPCADDDAQAVLPAYSPVAAQHLLAAAGWTRDGSGMVRRGGQPLRIVLATDTQRSNDVAEAELIQSSWQKLGIDAVLHHTTTDEGWGILLRGTGNFDVMMAGIALSLPTELQKYLSGPMPPAGRNYADIQNRTYDELAAEAARAPSEEQACRLWKQAEQSILRHADYVPIANTYMPLFMGHGAIAYQNSVRQPIPTSLRLSR